MHTNRGIKTSYKRLCLTGDGFADRILRKYGLFKDNCLNRALLIFRKDNTRGRKLSTAVYTNIINNTFVFRLYNFHLSDESIRQVLSRERQVYENISRDRSESVYKFEKIWSSNLNRHIKPEMLFVPVSRRIFSAMAEKQAPLILNGSGSDLIFRTNERGQPGGMLRTVTEYSKISAAAAGTVEKQGLYEAGRTVPPGVFSFSLPELDIDTRNKVQTQLNSGFGVIKILNKEFRNYRAVSYPANPGANLHQDNHGAPEQRYPEKFGYENRRRVYAIKDGQQGGILRTVTGGGKVSAAAAGILQNPGINLYRGDHGALEQRYPEKFGYENRRRVYAIKDGQPGGMLRTVTWGGKVSAAAEILQNPGTYRDDHGALEQRYPEKFGYENRRRVYAIRGSQPAGIPRTLTGGGIVSAAAAGILQNLGINLYRDDHETPTQRYSEKLGYENRQKSHYEQEPAGRADRFDRTLRHAGYPDVEFAESAGTDAVRFGGGIQRPFGERNLFKAKQKSSISLQLATESAQLVMSSRLLKKLQSAMSLKQRRELQFIGNAAPIWNSLSVIYAEAARKVRREENSILTEENPFAAASARQRYEMPLSDARSEKSMPNMSGTADLPKHIERYRRTRNIVGPEKTETVSENGTLEKEKKLSFRPQNQKRLKEKSLAKRERFLKVLDSKNLFYDRIRHMISEDRIYGIRLSTAQNRHNGETYRNVWEPQRRRNAFEKPFIPRVQEPFQIDRKRNSYGKMLMLSQESRSAELLSTRTEIGGEALSIQNEFGTGSQQKEKRYSPSEAAIQLISKGNSVFGPHIRRNCISEKKEISGKQPAYSNKDSTGYYVNKSKWLIGKYRNMKADNITVSSRKRITVTGSDMRFYRTDDSKMGVNWKEPETENLYKALSNIEIENQTQIALPDYPQMDFHRTREPDYEREAAKPKNETTVQDQVYRYEEGFKIGRADMERLVDNVCGKIERRLEFDRQRRGL